MSTGADSLRLTFRHRQAFGDDLLFVKAALQFVVDPLDGGPPGVLFVGFFGYEPNRDAADWFIDDIWPRILEQMPEARLRIAGSRHERLQAFGKELRNVELLGFVPDLIAEYARSHVFVCPIRSGAVRWRSLSSSEPTPNSRRMPVWS